MADNRWLDFLDGTGTDDRGRTFEDILAFDDRALERHHDFIQWLFPNPNASGVNPDAPLLTSEIGEAVKRDEKRTAQAIRGFDRMLAFYGFARSGEMIGSHDGKHTHWLHPGDHNHLRLTRILIFLERIGQGELAKALANRLLELPDRAVSPRTRDFWRSAAKL